jgi:translation initiation factor 2A
MIGGFGNLTGEMDFWDITNQKNPNQIGKAKSYCAIGIEWAADGVHLMTSVLYERLKVDNFVNVFTGAGGSLLGKGEEFE